MIAEHVIRLGPLVIGSVLAALLLAAQCTSPQPTPVPDPTPQGGATSASVCERAGMRVAELQCRTVEGTPLWQTPEGASFAEACEWAAQQGRDWHPECIATVNDCTELEAAYRGELCR